MITVQYLEPNAETTDVSNSSPADIELVELASIIHLSPLQIKRDMMGLSATKVAESALS